MGQYVEKFQRSYKMQACAPLPLVPCVSCLARHLCSSTSIPLRKHTSIIVRKKAFFHVRKGLGFLILTILSKIGSTQYGRALASAGLDSGYSYP